MNLNPGALLQGGKYRIVRFIKSGGFGCTYEAVHVLSCCTVAIKEFFVRDFCNRDSVTGNVHVLSVCKQELVDKLCGKFIDEAQMMMKMRYPGIVCVTDVFKENGTAYYVMDYIDGKSLGEIVAENGPLGEEVAVGYIKSVAAALKYVHGRNCLHLDVKPANILLAKEQESIFGNASSDGSSAASQNVMPLGSQKASVAKDESGEMKDERAKSKDATCLSMETGQNAANGSAAADEQEDIAVEVVETPSVAPEPAPRPQPEENQKKSKWLWIIILLAIICSAAVGFMFLGGGNDDAVVKDSANKKDSVNKEITVAENGKINGHEYVDLGLPSGLKWATCNVGASKPEEYGNYYAWGETSTKSSYTDDNNITYCKNFSDISGNPTYDAARKQWGSTWRLPTKAEFEELLNDNNCTWTWTTQNGVSGCKVTSKKNGNSIFLPAAGWRDGTSLIFQGTGGTYWSSTPHVSDTYYACSLAFGSGGHYREWFVREFGRGVRPVSGGIENKTEKTSNAKPASNKLSTRTFKAKDVEFTMVAVEGGTFSMGSNDGNSSEKPVHQVTLDSYCIGETEVTQALWHAVMGTTIHDQAKKGSNFKNLWGTGDNNPMYYLSYNDCLDFVNKLNTLLEDQLPRGRKFRLPTEAEWEYAARGGNKSKGYKYSGSNSISTVAWYRDNSGNKTHPVKQKASNELGLYDMSGNVLEWCSDWYGSNYYSSFPQNNPKGPSNGKYRVFRGGYWNNHVGDCRSAYRNFNDPDSRYPAYGLRLAF